MTTIFQAIKSVKTPPCEEFKCVYVNQCAEEKLACSAFKTYVNRDRTIPRYDTPTEKIYNNLFKGDEGDDE